MRVKFSVQSSPPPLQGTYRRTPNDIFMRERILHHNNTSPINKQQQRQKIARAGGARTALEKAAQSSWCTSVTTRPGLCGSAAAVAAKSLGREGGNVGTRVRDALWVCRGGRVISARNDGRSL